MINMSKGKVHWHDPFDDSEKTMDLDLHLARVMYWQLRDNSRKVWVTDEIGETVLAYEKKDYECPNCNTLHDGNFGAFCCESCFWNASNDEVSHKGG